MIFSFANQKGGVGKTTSSINIGASLASKGKSILLIDLDPQGNLSTSIGNKPSSVKSNNGTIYDVLTNNLDINKAIINTTNKNLDIIPSNINLAGAEVELVNMMSREFILKNKISEIKKKYEYVIIDCPPSLGLLTLNSFVASDKIIIPVQCEFLALEGISQLVETIKLVKNHLNPDLTIGGIILTMYDSRTNLGKEVIIEVDKIFNDRVFKTIIPRNIKLSEAPSFGLSIFDYAPTSNGAKTYEKLSDEFILRFKL